MNYSRLDWNVWESPRQGLIYPRCEHQAAPNV